jgi:glucose/arabinose dehydrogenase
MKLFICILIFLVVSCTVQEKNASAIFVEAFPNLTFNQAVDIQSPRDGTNRIFVLSQTGIIYVFNNDQKIKEKKVFLDITRKVLSGGELGLLGLAFHPEFKKNGFFYLNYTADSPRRTVIARYKASEDDSSNDYVARSEEILLEVEQPYPNHNGGQTSFGPDGYLYISLGDGGSAGDPKNSGQNLMSFLGKILRIDVDNKSNGKNYSIPNDNPFRGNNNGYREEIFAYGLRNVWRFSFDKMNRLWAGDVGQDKWEEINIIESGMNYGWRIMEGNHCYNPETDCDTTGLISPILEYGHDDMGGFSITGGFVYNGTSAPGLINKYIYADFVNGRVWKLEFVNNKVSNRLLIDSDFAISTFGLDENNELYFADYKRDGKLYKFVVKE